VVAVEVGVMVFYVVDVGDDFVLWFGDLEGCERVVGEGYGGLAVVGYWDLTPGMVGSLARFVGGDI